MVMASDFGSIDHQVTYLADAALQAAIRTGLPHHRVVHRVLRTTYFDSPEHELHHRGVTLRERCRVRKDGTLGPVKIEAKIPSATGLRRVAGPQARLAVADALGGGTVGRNVVGGLHPVAVQTKTRQLLLVAGARVAPQFVVALDEADVEVETGGQHQHRLEIETQIFTALPWTKRVNAARVERFSSFCRQLELDFGLRLATESGYHAIMEIASPSNDPSEATA
jgi:hypothetical protein